MSKPINFQDPSDLSNRFSNLKIQSVQPQQQGIPSFASSSLSSLNMGHVTTREAQQLTRSSIQPMDLSEPRDKGE